MPTFATLAPHQIADIIAGTNENLRFSIRLARNAAATFQPANIAWLRRLCPGLSEDDARRCLGYPKPLSTMSAAEYRNMAWRPNSPP